MSTDGQVGSGTTFRAARVSTHRGIKNPSWLTIEGTDGMTLRPPLTLATRQNIETGWDVFGHEVAQQKAQTLGTLSTQVEQALARLRTFDAGAPKTAREPQRSALVNDAADRVWALMIQRELCGLRQWDVVVKEYGIPREVLNRVGQVTR